MICVFITTLHITGFISLIPSVVIIWFLMSFSVSTHPTELITLKFLNRGRKHPWRRADTHKINLTIILLSLDRLMQLSEHFLSLLECPNKCIKGYIDTQFKIDTHCPNFRLALFNSPFEINWFNKSRCKIKYLF